MPKNVSIGRADRVRPSKPVTLVFLLFIICITVAAQARADRNDNPQLGEFDRSLCANATITGVPSGGSQKHFPVHLGYILSNAEHPNLFFRCTPFEYLKILKTEGGAWIPETVTFKAKDFPFSEAPQGFSQTFVCLMGMQESIFTIILSADGVITGSEVGAAKFTDSPAKVSNDLLWGNLGTAMPFSGSGFWEGKEVLDLKTGRDEVRLNVSFNASYKAGFLRHSIDGTIAVAGIGHREYRPIAPGPRAPQMGDVVIYWKGNQLMHSGVVASTDSQDPYRVKSITDYDQHRYGPADKLWPPDAPAPWLTPENPDSHKLPQTYGTWIVYHSNRNPDPEKARILNSVQPSGSNYSYYTDRGTRIVVKPDPPGANCHGYTFLDDPYRQISGYGLKGTFLPDSDPRFSDQGMAVEYILVENNFKQVYSKNADGTIVHFDPAYDTDVLSLSR